MGPPYRPSVHKRADAGGPGTVFCVRGRANSGHYSRLRRNKPRMLVSTLRHALPPMWLGREGQGSAEGPRPKLHMAVNEQEQNDQF